MELYPPTVLIVDDEPAIRQILQLFCDRLGLRAVATGSGHDAVALYEQHRPTIRLVLLDVNMPAIDGPATLVRLQEVGLEACVCFMSGNTGRYSVESLLALGAERFFEKPFRFDRFGAELLALTGEARVAA